MTFTPDIILVGNGPAALSWPAGSLIDACPQVGRFNNFKTEGYEEFVGSKTTVWIRNDTQTVLPRDDSLPTLVVTKPDRARPGDLVPSLYPGGWASTGVTAILYFVQQGLRVGLHGFDFFKAATHHYFPSESRNTVHDPEQELKLLALHFAFGQLAVLREPECRSPYLPTKAQLRQWRSNA